MFWLGIVTMSIRSSRSRSTGSISMLAVPTERLTSFLPGMIDVRCTNELIDLRWMNGEL